MIQPGVGDRRVHDVGRDAVRGELAGRRHRVVLQRRLGRAVGDLLGEAHRSARRQPDDPSPRRRRGRRGGGPARPASSAPALASTPRLRSIVAGETAVSGRPRRSTASGVNVSATHPLALLTRIDTGPSRARPRRRAGRRRRASVRSASTATARPGSGSMAARTSSASAARCRPYASEPGRRTPAPQVRDQDVDAGGRQRDGGGRADAVVGAGDDGDAPLGRRRRGGGHDGSTMTCGPIRTRSGAHPWSMMAAWG